MIPFFLIAAAGLGLAAYVFSPATHAWADDHYRAIREALTHHQEADGHLAVVSTTSDPAVAAASARAANAANQKAATFTAAAAATAKTPAQQATATQSAAVVTARQDKIADVSASAVFAKARAAEAAAQGGRFYGTPS